MLEQAVTDMQAPAAVPAGKQAARTECFRALDRPASICVLMRRCFQQSQPAMSRSTSKPATVLQLAASPLIHTWGDYIAWNDLRRFDSFCAPR
jgi:hypothetical protein